MSQHLGKLLLTAIGASVSIGSASAGTIDSSAFDVDPASTSIDTTGSDVVDWGYFLPTADFLDGDQPADTDFDDLVAVGGTLDPGTNSKASPGIGIVTITPRDVAEYSNGTTLALWDFTVGAGDGTVFSGGTQTPLGAVNGVAGGEDIFEIEFNDIGAGTTTVTLYMAHTNTGRTFSAITGLTATDGNDSNPALISSSIGGSDGFGYFTYTAVVTTTDDNADLSIAIDSNSGGSGQFAFAGYTVVNPIPEPGSLALLGLGGLLVASRRRRA